MKEFFTHMRNPQYNSYALKTDVNKRDFRLKGRDFSVFDSDENLYRDSVDIGKLVCIRIFRSMITK